MARADEVAELTRLLRARFPIILIATHEEPRVLGLLENACERSNQAIFTWSIANGLGRARSRDTVYNTNELIEALKHIDKTPHNGVYVMCDAHPGFKDAVCIRLIREIAMEHSLTARTLVFISPTFDGLPAEILRLSAHFSPCLPDLSRVRAILAEELEIYRSQHGANARGDRAAVDRLVRHLIGMDNEEVRRFIRHSLRDDGMLNQDDVRRILRTKYESQGGTGALEYCAQGAGFDVVGGLANLKHWIQLRRKPFLESEHDDMDRPKGVLLLGVQGAGKSLAARAVAGEWDIPLLRLDLGALYNKYYGETERNLRNALSATDTMAPCVLWIDELEKGLATDSGHGDGAVSRRLLGTLLTWLSERTRPAFIIATANDVSQLPPELIRKGRFDEIFFLDLPQTNAREQIFRIHLTKRKLDPDRMDCARLSALCAGFSGAEIEQAIVSALFGARAEGKALDTAALEAELQRTRPLSLIMAEKLEALRQWASNRAVFADEATSSLA